MGIIIEEPIALSIKIIPSLEPTSSSHPKPLHVRDKGKRTTEALSPHKEDEPLASCFVDHIFENLPTFAMKKELENLYGETDPLTMVIRYLMKVCSMNYFLFFS